MATPFGVCRRINLETVEARPPGRPGAGHMSETHAILPELNKVVASTSTPISHRQDPGNVWHSRLPIRFAFSRARSQSGLVQHPVLKPSSIPARQNSLHTCFDRVRMVQDVGSEPPARSSLVHSARRRPECNFALQKRFWLCSCKPRIAWGVVSLIRSATARSPATASFTDRNITVLPSPRRRSASSVTEADIFVSPRAGLAPAE